MANRQYARVRLVIGTVMILGLLVQRGTAQGPIPTHMFDNWAKLVDAGDVKTLITLFQWQEVDRAEPVRVRFETHPEAVEDLALHLLPSIAVASSQVGAAPVDWQLLTGNC